MSPRLKAALQLVASVVATSLTGVLAKRSLQDVAPHTFAWLQLVFGIVAMTFYTFVIKKERVPKIPHKIWGYIIAVGLLNFSVVRVLYMLSLQKLPATTHVYLFNFVSIFTIFFSIPLLNEKPTVGQVIGILISFLGLQVFFQTIPRPDELDGVILLVGAVLALALTNNLSRMLRLAAGESPSNNIISTMAIWVGAAPVVLWGLLADFPPVVKGYGDWAVIILNGVVVIAAALAIWNHVVKTLRSYEASLLACSSVIFTALFAIPILHEALESHHLLGITLMFVGLVVVQLRQK